VLCKGSVAPPFAGICCSGRGRGETPWQQTQQRPKERQWDYAWAASSARKIPKRNAAHVSNQNCSDECCCSSLTEYSLAMLPKPRPFVMHLYCELGTRKWLMPHANLRLHCNAPSKVNLDQPMHIHARESGEMVSAKEHKESAHLPAGDLCCFV